MCTNFTSNLDQDWSRKHLGLELTQELPLEAYPGYLAPFLRLEKNASGTLSYALSPARFGLVPHWTQEAEVQRISRYTYNARSETASTKPSYRTPFRQRHWGVVLLKDFFEPSYESGQAQRMRISLMSDEPFGVACLWDEWRAVGAHDDGSQTVSPELTQPPKSVPVLSFSMLTLNADQHPVMSRMHAPGEEKRTPLVLTLDQFKPWLEASHEEARQWLRGEHMPTLKSQLAPSTRIQKGAKSVANEKANAKPNSNFNPSAGQGQLF